MNAGTLHPGAFLASCWSVTMKTDEKTVAGREERLARRTARQERRLARLEAAAAKDAKVEKKAGKKAELDTRPDTDDEFEGDLATLDSEQGGKKLPPDVPAKP